MCVSHHHNVCGTFDIISKRNIHFYVFVSKSTLFVSLLLVLGSTLVEHSDILCELSLSKYTFPVY